jgi:intracellular sulfur oxidation DsrE/DsrF family protein
MCRNTMENIGSHENDLYSFVKTVPSGVGEVVKRQKEGWQYIKAE